MTTSRERTWPTFFAFDVADYLAGTLDFDATDHGCYLLLLLAQFNSRELYGVSAAPRDLRTICRGQKPSARVLAKFEEVRSDDDQVLLRNRRMRKETDIASQQWQGAIKRRRDWKEKKARQRAGQPGDVPGDKQGDRGRDLYGEGTTLERERERERDTSSLRSDVDHPAAVLAGGRRSASEQGPPARPRPPGEGSQPAGNGHDGSALKFDPSNDLQARLAAYCETLAQLEADRDGDPPDPRRILETVSATPSGKSLDSLQKASAAWLAISVRQAQRFALDEFGVDDLDALVSTRSVQRS